MAALNIFREARRTELYVEDGKRSDGSQRYIRHPLSVVTIPQVTNGDQDTYLSTDGSIIDEVILVDGVNKNDERRIRDAYSSFGVPSNPGAVVSLSAGDWKSAETPLNLTSIDLL